MTRSFASASALSMICDATPLANAKVCVLCRNVAVIGMTPHEQIGNGTSNAAAVAALFTPSCPIMRKTVAWQVGTFVTLEPEFSADAKRELAALKKFC